MGIVPTEMELILEHTLQGISHEVSVSTKGVEELKRNVKIKGVKKEALLTHLAKIGSIHMLSETLSCCLVTPTKPGRMSKPYSSHRFIANCFNAGNLKMEVKTILTKAGNNVKKILLNLNLSDHRSILMDLQVTPTKPGRMTKTYSSHRFIVNYFNARNLKMEVKILSSCSSGKSSTMARILSSVDIGSRNIYTNSGNIL
nr:hypothetical protein [Tanacetum cinerariifolium]